MLDASSLQWSAVLVVVAVSALVWRKRTRPYSPERYLIPDPPKDTVILHQFGPAPCVPSVSPFVIKLETYLRATGIPYVNKFDRRPGPKGKLPWIQYNNQVVPDSQACVEFLNEERGVNLNKKLTNQQLAVGHVIRRTAEEFLYWTTIMWRLEFDPEMTLYRGLGLPRPFLWYMRRVSAGRTSAQGIGRHSQAEVVRLMDDDLAAIDSLMEGRQFLFSDSPDNVTEFDCALFGQLCQLIWQCPGTPAGPRIQEKFPRLVKYCERMKSALWPDWDERLKQPSPTKATKTTPGETERSEEAKVTPNMNENQVVGGGKDEEKDTFL